MKRILRDSSIHSILLLSVFLFGCSLNDKSKEGVHAPINYDVIHGRPSSFAGTSDKVVMANVKTVKPQKGSRFESISAPGVITYNENNLRSLSSRVSGRIERLFVKFNYQAVTKGQKLMDIYSPDLASAQQELLFLYRNNEPELAALARKKLLLLGATPQQINKLLTTGKVDYTVTIYSSFSGYIIENLASSKITNTSVGSTVITSSSGSGSSGSMGNMGPSGPSSQTTPVIQDASPLQLREGEYVSQGQALFKLINTENVWADFYVQQDQLNNFKKGVSVLVKSANTREKYKESSISMIQPYYSSGVSQPLVRVVLPNIDKVWRIGELVLLDLKEVKKSGTWLPRSAVLELGNRRVAFVRRSGNFEPVDVKIYSTTGDWVDVGDSLGDQEVAVNAWFLMDSESFVQVEHN